MTRFRALLGALLAAAGLAHAQSPDPLPSWNDGAARARIVAFVRAVTDQGSKDFVPAAERIAVFDNDGTLWAEQPAYFQLLFALVPMLVRQPALNFIDGKEGKPVGILQHIGRRPIAAFGNSDGHFQMLEWVTAGPGARFGLIVHHDDAEREYAYDRESHIGRLARGLDEGPKRGWTIVSMKNDWKAIFPGGGSGQ